MSLDVYRSLWKDERLNGVVLLLKPGSDVDKVTAELRQKLSGFGRMEVQPSAALRRDALIVFDRTFAITSAMQMLTTLVAFIGVLSSLLALQLEKAREMGVLRALGMTISEMRSLTLWETGLLGASAGLLSIPVGLHPGLDPGLHHQPAFLRLDAADAGPAWALRAGVFVVGGRGAAGRDLPGVAVEPDGSGGGVARGIAPPPGLREAYLQVPPTGGGALVDMNEVMG